MSAGAVNMETPTELYASGHRGCAGCGQMTAVRMVLNVAGPNTIVANNTGCLEVTSSGYPETAWRVPWIHVAFENAAAVASGIDAALKRLGKREGVNILAFAGDGGTFDIGFQALSGMLERGHNVTYVVFDNEAYMNTGIQRCSSTPLGAATTTSPAGKVIPGKMGRKKPIAAIVAAHDTAYVATASIAYPVDLQNKVKKALAYDGPSFIHIFAPCTPGWRINTDDTIKVARLAVETGVFIPWELEGGDFSKINITVKPPNPPKPVEEYLKLQGRYRHLFKHPDGPKVIEEIKKEINEKLERYGLL